MKTFALFVAFHFRFIVDFYFIVSHDFQLVYFIVILKTKQQQQKVLQQK